EEREAVREDLTRMVQVREPVDDGDPRTGREIDDALVQERARHHEVDPPLEVPRDVAGGLPLPEADVAGCQVDRGAAELHHLDLERDPGPQARLLEDHGERSPREERVRLSSPELALEARGDREHGVDLGARQIGDAEEVPLHPATASSRIANPSSTCVCVTTSGGRKRSTRSAVQLMSKPLSRARETIGAPGSSSTAPSIRPAPRTADAPKSRSSRERKCAPTSRTWARRAGSASAVRAATAAAHATGFPPNVDPCEPGPS